MMPSKKKHVVTSDVSSNLFVSDGKPMSFYVRPGPIRRKLQPHITSGGGVLCKVQQPGVTLLIDPSERASIPESTSHWYVSTTYIDDCVKKNKLLNLEEYRLNPKETPTASTSVNAKGQNVQFKRGRTSYTAEEDAAILNYVNKHRKQTGGVLLWQKMEKLRVTRHSWQSMKHRYRQQLAKKQFEVKEVNVPEAEEEENQEMDVSDPSSENIGSPPTHSTAVEAPETHEAQMDAEPREAEITEPQNSEAGTSKNLTEGEETQLDLQTDANPLPPEGTEAETVESQTTVSPQKECGQKEDREGTPSLTTTPNRIPEASGEAEVPPQRRSTRRRLNLDATAPHEPLSKKVRSVTVPSPKSVRKTKSAVRSNDENKTTDDSPPSKKDRGHSETAGEEHQQTVENDDADESETTQPESQSLLDNGNREKEKRKLGILEMATKEFEDEDETSEDEAVDVQPKVTEKQQAPLAPPPDLPTDRPAEQVSTRSDPGPKPGAQVEPEQLQNLSPECVTETEPPEPETSVRAAAQNSHAASRAHLFIFDSESQEVDSPAVVGDRAAAPSNSQPPVNKDSALCLTQLQLEEDVQQIKALMETTNKDIYSVTKALLKTSGDFSAALNLLVKPSDFSGPFWNHSDDSLLLSADPVVRRHLQDKYGETELAKRIVFLELEG